MYIRTGDVSSDFGTNPKQPNCPLIADIRRVYNQVFKDLRNQANSSQNCDLKILTLSKHSPRNVVG